MRGQRLHPAPSAPRGRGAVVEHEHAVDVEAARQVGHELIRRGRECAVAIHELRRAACGRGRVGSASAHGRGRAVWPPAHTSVSPAWQRSCLRRKVKIEWKCSCASILNLFCLSTGAPPTWRKLTTTVRVRATGARPARRGCGASACGGRLCSMAVPACVERAHLCRRVLPARWRGRVVAGDRTQGRVSTRASASRKGARDTCGSTGRRRALGTSIAMAARAEPVRRWRPSFYFPRKESRLPGSCRKTTTRRVSFRPTFRPFEKKGKLFQFHRHRHCTPAWALQAWWPRWPRQTPSR